MPRDPTGPRAFPLRDKMGTLGDHWFFVNSAVGKVAHAVRGSLPTDRSDQASAAGGVARVRFPLGISGLFGFAEVDQPRLLTPASGHRRQPRVLSTSGSYADAAGPPNPARPFKPRIQSAWATRHIRIKPKSCQRAVSRRDPKRDERTQFLLRLNGIRRIYRHGYSAAPSDGFKNRTNEAIWSVGDTAG